MNMLILVLALFSKGTRVCGFAITGTITVTVSDPFEARIVHVVSELPSALHITRHETNRRSRSQNNVLLAHSNDNDGSNSNSDSMPSSQSPRVKFSDDSSSSSLASPLDQFLTLIASDAFSIVSGLIGLLAVVVYRWNLVLAVDSGTGRAAAEALTYQTRSDLLAVFASGSVLLNGVTKLDVTTALAESVILEGTTLSEPERIRSSNSNSNTLNWALESLLEATPAKTAVLVTDIDDRWTIQCRAGVVPSSPSSLSVPEKTPILERVGAPENSKETYLPTLQALPGRTELTYLPSNAQMAVLIPIQRSSSSSSSKNSVLVLGGNTAKSFSPRDIAWSRIVAEKVGENI